MGEIIQLTNTGDIVTPENPVIPYFAGDGIGPDIWFAAQMVLDAAVEKAYGGKRKIEWLEILAGEKANEKTGSFLPDESVEAIKKYRVAIKGPLTTPVGGGMRSINVMLRLILDLYACVRPVSYISGVPSPVKEPEKVDMIIFRENTEDVYCGIEWEAGTPEAAEMMALVKKLTNKDIRPDSGIGVKPMSKTGTRRLVRQAILFALQNNRDSVTLVHKGNIMKYTEGAFRNWGYELAAEEFGDVTITEAELWDKYDGKMPATKKIVIKDRIADAMFQQILLRPAEYSVLAMPNLNGDYISDSLAAMVGGLGMAPGANIGDGVALFEATHGTAPKYAGQDKVNPGSVILSGAMMLDHIHWNEAAQLVRSALAKAIATKQVTYDLARQMEGSTKVSCSDFGRVLVSQM